MRKIFEIEIFDISFTFYGKDKTFEKEINVCVGKLTFEIIFFLIEISPD